jgi:alpha-beta hydrolase superfamily lysophospholipase
VETTREGRLVAADGTRLLWRWHGTADPVATLLVHHGVGEHMRRYGHLVEAMIGAGVEVVLYDARGHGASGGRRGHVARFADYADDLRLVLAMVREGAGRAPFLLGHSMGGLVVCQAALQAPLPVAGIALSNPGLAAAVAVPGWKLAAAQVLSRWAPTIALPTGLPAEHISRDPESVRDYRDDPAIFGSVTTRWGAEFLAAQREVQATPLELSCPLLVLLGTGDRIVDAAASERTFASARAPELQIERFEGFYHELFNEPAGERDRPLAALRDWIERHR